MIGRRARRAGWVGLALLLSHCASFGGGDDSSYETVPMNRVVPYPTAEERALANARVVLSSHFLAEAPEDAVGFLVEQAIASVDRNLAETGAIVVARGVEDLADVDADVVDYALVVTTSQFRYSTQWAAATNWLFKSDEEMAQVPGTCTHLAEVEVLIAAYAIPSTEGPIRTYVLTHEGEAESENLDTNCPYAESDRRALFESVLDEALACVRFPLLNHFASRGWIEEQRQPSGGGDPRFRTSLGQGNGAKEGRKVEIHRVQVSTTLDGAEHRSENKIADGVVTNRVFDDRSWVHVDADRILQPILEGDIVRPVYAKSKLSTATDFSGCGDILAVK